MRRTAEHSYPLTDVNAILERLVTLQEHLFEDADRNLRLMQDAHGREEYARCEQREMVYRHSAVRVNQIVASIRHDLYWSAIDAQKEQH